MDGDRMFIEVLAGWMGVMLASRGSFSLVFTRYDIDVPATFPFCSVSRLYSLVLHKPTNKQIPALYLTCGREVLYVAAFQV